MIGSPPPLLVAIDTGGTFTDVVAVDGARILEEKVPSTPEDPSRAVAEGVRRVEARAGRRAALLIHGTTVATNALLERRGAPTWFVTNAGMEDLLRIGRQHRGSLYALHPEERPVLVDRAHTVGVGGRRRPDGRSSAALDTSALVRSLATLDDTPRAWAVCLLHSYADPSDERAVAEVIRQARPGDHVSLSSEVLPVFREVERASTTVANAFVAPGMARYLERLVPLAERVEVMGSAGDRLLLEEARRVPIQTALSGPAGGVVAAGRAARSLGFEAAISFDMGGTSTDVAFVGDTLPLRYAQQVGPFPVHLPMLDIHTVGAGGGSIAHIDSAGILKVGPRSAGADPGPACYGRGMLPTVTDANVVLGRLPADTRLGGSLALHPERAWQALAPVAEGLGVTVPEVALGVVRIANEAMVRAIRRVSVERGLDPRRVPLCSFGGAGGLHACALAESLGMETVLVPARAGLLSAVGMLLGRPGAMRSRTVLGRSDAEIAADFAAFEATLRGQLGADAAVVRRADLRYRGQSFELTVDWGAGRAEAVARFEAEHEARFGYRLDAEVEPVHVRVAATVAAPEVPLLEGGGQVEARFRGETVVVDMSSTTWVPAGWVGERWQDGSLVLRREAASGGAP